MADDPQQLIVSADEIIPRLWVGNQAAAGSWPFMERNRITMIVNCTRNVPNSFADKLLYYQLPIDDPGVNVSRDDSNVKQLKLCAPALALAIDQELRNGGRILCHCHAGIQRSAAIAAYYLMWYTPNQPPTVAEKYSNAVQHILRRRKKAFYRGTSVNFRHALLSL